MDHPTIHLVGGEACTFESLFPMLSRIGLRASTHDGSEGFLSSFDPSLPCCVVIDAGLHRMGAAELLRRLESTRPQVACILVSDRTGVALAVEAMKHGAVDVLERPFSVESIVAALRSALEIDAARRRSYHVETEINARLDLLTPRERQVLLMVVTGDANKTIAAKLCVSPKTVEVHRSNMMRKMHVGSLPELVRFVQSASLATELPPIEPALHGTPVFQTR